MLPPRAEPFRRSETPTSQGARPAGSRWSLRCGPVADGQVCVLGVAQVGADERAEGYELEVAGAEVVEGAGDQPSSEPLSLEGGVDFGVDQQVVLGSDR